MVTTTPMETRDRVWSPVLEEVRAAALDCLQANLAAAADHHGGTGTHLALGSPLRFDLAPATDGRAAVADSLERRLAEAADLLGLRVARRWDGLDGPALRALAAEHGPLYVVADGYRLDWLPDAGQRHSEHSFLLVKPDMVADAYHDDTQWGTARPGVWRLTPADLDAALPDSAALLLTHEPAPAQDPDAVLADNARALRAAVPDIDAYVAAVPGAEGAEAIDRVVLDVWLLGRSRLLHAAWLRSVGLPGPAAAVDEQAQAWLTLASQTYVAARRARRGGALPGSVAEEVGRLLHGDVALAEKLAPAGEPGDDVREAVLAELRSVLRIEDADVAAAATLRDLPNFNSFRLLDVIERVEARLGIELDADDLTADALHDVDSFCGIFTRRSR